LVLLTLWGVWWGCSLHKGKLIGASRTWVPAWQFVGLDFLNNYYATRYWQTVGDPYATADLGDPLVRKFCYPPVHLPLFAWCRFLSPRAAVHAWTVLLAFMVGLGAWAAWRSRQELQLYALPLGLIAAAALWSAPVCFALERGNCDLLVVLLIVPAAWALRGRSFWRDALAGGCLALAAWVKVYPAVLLLGLIPLRRPRALVCGGVAAAALTGVQWPYLPGFLDNARELAAVHAPHVSGHFHITVHTLSGCWKLLWTAKDLQWLAKVPGTLGAAAILFPIIMWVSWRVYRSAKVSHLLYPYFVWLAAAATYLPPVSNDYNLIFLPLAALAVWDRRDPVWVHVLGAYMLLWWQPYPLPIGPKLLLLTKLLALVAVGGSLAARAREQVLAGQEQNASASRTRPPLPAAA
jgi:hypothetical protein